MGQAAFLEKSQVIENIDKVQSFLSEKNLDGMYLSSSDPYLSEYIPLEDCHRFYVTGFTGSMAEVLVPAQGKVMLFVDGRYHEQADLEVDLSRVEVVKCPHAVSNEKALLEKLSEHKMTKIGVEGNRTSYAFEKKLKEQVEVKAFDQLELHSVIDFKKLPPMREVQYLNVDLCGKTPAQKLEDLIANDKEAYFITALDSLAWLTNCRGYHMPSQSQYYGRALAINGAVHIFVPQGCPLGDSVKQDSTLHFHVVTDEQMKSKLKELQGQLSLETVKFDPDQLNAADYRMLSEVFTEERLQVNKGGIVMAHAIKNPTEIQQMEIAFQKAEQAIYRTINWVKNEIKGGNSVTEKRFYDQANHFYRDGGAHDQSFNTIAAVGPNSSIVHFSSPSDETVISGEELILLDSGGYYDAGFATDCTRTFWAGTGKPTAKHKEIYTYVLKSLLQLQNAVFPEGTTGAFLDGVTRMPLHRAGYNFNHGTGHGVGINVHEGGYRISPASPTPMKEGLVGSLEPGIYLPGFGGVRLENVAVVEKHPEFEGMLRFRSLIFLGFEPKLIELSLLNEDETQWLAEYEAQCSERGCSFK